MKTSTSNSPRGKISPNQHLYENDSDLHSNSDYQNMKNLHHNLVLNSTPGATTNPFQTPLTQIPTSHPKSSTLNNIHNLSNNSNATPKTKHVRRQRTSSIEMGGSAAKMNETIRQNNTSSPDLLDNHAAISNLIPNSTNHHHHQHNNNSSHGEQNLSTHHHRNNVKDIRKKIEQWNIKNDTQLNNLNHHPNNINSANHMTVSNSPINVANSPGKFNPTQPNHVSPMTNGILDNITHISTFQMRTQNNSNLSGNQLVINNYDNNNNMNSTTGEKLDNIAPQAVNSLATQINTSQNNQISPKPSSGVNNLPSPSQRTSSLHHNLINHKQSPTGANSKFENANQVNSNNNNINNHNMMSTPVAQNTHHLIKSLDSTNFVAPHINSMGNLVAINQINSTTQQQNKNINSSVNVNTNPMSPTHQAGQNPNLNSNSMIISTSGIGSLTSGMTVGHAGHGSSQQNQNQGLGLASNATTTTTMLAQNRQ